ncbi:D-methionine transport system ATP-binding protein [Lachnospiraceae bacterium C7]|nr:D-methionine transport system ATP-binding protein [Lachnospiraceae bacterium C7]
MYNTKKAKEEYCEANSKNSAALIEFCNVSKLYNTTNGGVKALSNVNLKIKKNSICGIIGLSGAGKSTLVRCINLLEKPTEGNVYLNGDDLTLLSEVALRKKRQKMGMIFQHFNLLDQRDAIGNVCFPLEIAGVSKKDAIIKAKELLKLVGLEDRMHNYPSQLSGGQKQRVAIARALATDPEVLLCDEATSALDPNTTRAILALLKKINNELNVTIVIITHEMRVVEQICDYVAVVDAGKIVEQGNVQDVFLKPKSKVTREMLFPNRDIGIGNAKRKIFRLSFDGQSSSEPVIANLVLKCQAKVNILGASTEDIGGKAFGQMIIEMPENEMAIARVKEYLDDIKIHYEEEK